MSGEGARLPVPRRLRELRGLVELVRLRRAGDERQRAAASLALLERLRQRVFPAYRLTEQAKSWWTDAAFADMVQRLTPGGDFGAERKFMLRELLKLVAELDGDTAEAGIYQGASSYFICQARADRRSTHWAYDSFEGLSAPRGDDGAHWQAGDLRSGEDVARATLAPFDAHLVKGWIPDVFAQAEPGPLVFAHIDVDLYEPTLASLEFFYPRLVAGGILVCDDYGFTTCPGARRAVDEFMASRPEPVLHCPSGQGVIIKR